MEEFFINLPVLVNILLILFSLMVVLRSAHYLVDGAVSFAHELNVSPLIIGATVVAMGTTSAENTVNLVIVLTGEDTSTVVGNILGSNLVNFGIELGVSILIAGIILVPRMVFEKDLPMYLGAAGLLTAMAADGYIQQTEGIVLIIAYCAAIMLIIQYAKARDKESVLLVEAKEIEEIFHPGAKTLSRQNAFIYLVGGIIVLIFSSRLLIFNTEAVAFELGIPEFIIGLLIIGPGTSIPEIASSIQAARRGHADLVLGTVFGSCLFNFLLGLGLPSIIRPLVVEDAGRLGFAFINFLNLLLLILLLVDIPWLGRSRTFTRKIGIFLIVTYLGFISYQVVTVAGIQMSTWYIFIMALTLGAIGFSFVWERISKGASLDVGRSVQKKRILCATRGGEASRPTHEAAIVMANEVDADLYFLYVFDQAVLSKFATPIVINVEAQMNHMRRFLERTIKPQALKAGVCTEVLVRVGSLRDQLKIVGKEIGIDVIILGNPLEATSLFKREALQTLALEIEEDTGIQVVPLLGLEGKIPEEVVESER